MTTLLDANVLVALIVVEHVHHAPAEAYLVSGDGPFATCPITEGALVRFLVREGVAVGTAANALREIARHPRHVFWPDDLALTDVDLSRVDGHRQVTDAYLAGLARAHGGRIATFDRALAAAHADVADFVGSRS